MTSVATTGCGAPANGSIRRRSALLILLSAMGLVLCAAASPALAGGFERTGDLNVARSSPMVVKLADGRVLVAGGLTTGNVKTKTAEIYDPASGTFTPTAGQMAVERFLGTAVLLPNGKVLFVGGQEGSIHSTAELFDPATGTFTNVSSTMSGGRVWPLVTLLDSGKVLVSHGCCSPVSADLYDPNNGLTGTFAPTTGQPSLAYSNNTGTATKLANGKVLVAGDWNDGPSARYAQIYDPATDRFANTAGLMVIQRAVSLAMRLASGKVLIAGATDASENTAEIFDPVTGLFTATPGNMSAGRAQGYIAPLPGGRVLVAGGASIWAGVPNSSADIFDPATGTFTPVGAMSVARRQITVSNPPVLADGRVLFAGGATAASASPDYDAPTVISELYVPDGWAPSPSPSPVDPAPTPDPVTPTPVPVTPTPNPSPLTPPAPTNTLTLSPIRVLGSSIRSFIIVTGPGVANQRGSFSGGAGARNSKTLTACRSSRTITKAGRYKVSCKLTAAARSARRRGPIRVTLTTTFTPTGGTASAIERKVTLKKTSSGVTG